MSKGKKLNVKAIIQKNPIVDAEKLEQGLKALKELAKTGVKPSTYSLETPESGKTMHRVLSSNSHRKATASHRSA